MCRGCLGLLMTKYGMVGWHVWPPSGQAGRNKHSWLDVQPNTQFRYGRLRDFRYGLKKSFWFVSLCFVVDKWSSSWIHFIIIPTFWHWLFFRVASLALGKSKNFISPVPVKNPLMIWVKLVHTIWTLNIILEMYCIYKSILVRDHSLHGLSQWETTLHCNGVSHWLSPFTVLFLLVLITLILHPLIAR